MTLCKVLIIDDDNAFRQAIRSLLRDQFPAIEIREANNHHEALQRIDGLHLVFVDISLPGESGLDLVAHLKSVYPELIVAILTIYDTLEYRDAAFEQGADYFVSKSAPADEIIEAVQSACPHASTRYML